MRGTVNGPRIQLGSLAVRIRVYPSSAL
jgi:hypothetical protein